MALLDTPGQLLRLCLSCPGQRAVLVLGSRGGGRKLSLVISFHGLLSRHFAPPCTSLFSNQRSSPGFSDTSAHHRGSKLDGSCDKKAEEQMPRSTSDRSTRNLRRCKGKNQTFRGACNLRNLGQILTSVSRICPESGQQFGNDGKGCHFGQI